MASYLINLTGAFNSTYSYPWSGAVTITSAVEPVKRVRTLEVGTVDTLFDREDILGCRAIIRNLDSTENIRIGISDTSSDTVYFQLAPGQMLALPGTKIDVNTSGAAFSAYRDWDVITGEAESGTPQVELLVIGSDETAS